MIGLILATMTLEEIDKMAKNLRWKFPDKDVNIIFESGKPRIVVDG